MLDVVIAAGDLALRNLLAGNVRTAGHHVECVGDGEELNTILVSRAFDVVIADIQAPGLNAIDLLRRLRIDGSHADAILIAGSGEVREAVTALKEGASDYLTQPVDVDEFSLRIQRIGDQIEISRIRGAV